MSWRPVSRGKRSDAMISSPNYGLSFQIYMTETLGIKLTGIKYPLVEIGRLTAKRLSVMRKLFHFRVTELISQGLPDSSALSFLQCLGD